MRALRNLIVAAATMAVVSAAAAQFAVDWYTVDGGGAMFTTGGNYELSGTIGQPDAGVTMTGGSYSLTGGFWVVAAPTPGACLGDVNCDGKVDFKDIDPFVARLGCPASNPATCNAPANCTWLNADINQDGSVTFQDIDPFVGTLGHICP